MIKVRRGGLAAVSLMACIATALSLALVTPAASAAPVPPTQDAFYSYSGSLSAAAPGTVLRTRSVSFNASGLTVPVTATQILYRTTDELGNPTIAVTTVVQPLAERDHQDRVLSVGLRRACLQLRAVLCDPGREPDGVHQFRGAGPDGAAARSRRHGRRVGL